MKRLERVVATGLIILLLVIAGTVGSAVGQPPRSEAGLVIEAAQILGEYYVDRVDQARLLGAAVGGLRATLSAAGVAGELEAIAPGTTTGEAARLFTLRFDAAQAALQAKGTPRQLAYAAIRAMTVSLNDSHTGFLTPEDYREKLLRQEGQAYFSGVGMTLMTREGRFYVRDIIPASPAETLGLRAFDRVIRVNDVSTKGMTLEQVVSTIRGPTGTSVTLTLERPGRTEPVVVTITRAPISVPPLLRVSTLEPGFGYIYLYHFIDGTTRDFRGALQRLQGQGLRGLIIDLRGNVGGFVHELQTVLNLLLPKGTPVLRETSRGGRVQVVATTGGTILPAAVPIVVLIDQGSASGAELMAAALGEHGRGTLVGSRTAGAVEASIFVRLSDGSALSVTIRRLSTGKGHRLEGVGVSPQVEVELTTEDLDRGRDSQLERALQVARQHVARAQTRPARVPSAGH